MNMLGRGGLSQELNKATLRGMQSENSMRSYRSIEETVISTPSKNFYPR